MRAPVTRLLLLVAVAVSTVEGATGLLQFVHASASTPDVDLAFNGITRFTQISAYIVTEPMVSYTSGSPITVRNHATQELLLTSSITIAEEGALYTVYMYGNMSMPAAPLSMLGVQINTTAPPWGTVEMRVLHFAVNLPPAKVVLNTTGDIPAFPALIYGSVDPYGTIAAGAYELLIVNANATDQDLIQPYNLPLNAGIRLTFYICNEVDPTKPHDIRLLKMKSNDYTPTPDGTATFRFANMIVGSDITFLVDGDESQQTLPYPNTTAYLPPVNSGVQLTLVGKDLDYKNVLVTVVELTNDLKYVAFAAGTEGSTEKMWKPRVIMVPEDSEPAPRGEAKLYFVHVASERPPAAVGFENGTLWNNVTFGEQGNGGAFITIPSGPHNITAYDFFNEDAFGPVIVDTQEQVFPECSVSLMYLHGYSSPSATPSITPTPVSMSVTPSMTPTPSVTSSVTPTETPTRSPDPPTPPPSTRRRAARIRAAPEDAPLTLTIVTRAVDCATPAPPEPVNRAPLSPTIIAIIVGGVLALVVVGIITGLCVRHYRQRSRYQILG